MLTLQCRKVLNGLKRLSSNTECNISYLYDTTCFCNDDITETYDYGDYEDEIDSIISHLALCQLCLHYTYLCSFCQLFFVTSVHFFY